MGANFGSVALACGIWFGVNKDDGAIWGGFVALFGWYFAGIALTLFFLNKKMAEEPDKWTWHTILWEISFKNVYDLTQRIKPVVGYFPFAWCFLVKQFMPHVLLILFVNLAQSDNGYGEPILGNYGNYATRPFQVLGVLTFVFAASLFMLGFIVPQLYYPLRLPPGHFGLDPEGGRAKPAGKNPDDEVEVLDEAEEEVDVGEEVAPSKEEAVEA